MLTKEQILKEFDRYELSFRTGDGDWFEGVSYDDFDKIADRLLELCNTQTEDNN